MSARTKARSSAVLLGITLALGTAPALADSTPSGGNPWSDVASSSFVAPAGTPCPFPLSGTVVSDDEQIRTLTTHPDGSPETQKVVGQLVMDFRNDDTGATVRRNLTGNGIFTWRADGSLASLLLEGGHFAAGLGATHPDGPAFLVFSGAGHEVTFEPDGTRTVTYGSGPVEDLCVTLAG